MSEEVTLTADPFGFPGTRISQWFGPLHIERTVRGSSWEEALYEIHESAREVARDRSCNGVIGIEIECDPYHRDGARLSLKGTTVRHVPLFAGVEVAFP